VSEIALFALIVPTVAGPSIFVGFPRMSSTRKMHRLITVARLYIIVFGVLSLVVWVALTSLPGLGITYLGWKFTRKMRPVVAQAAFRAGLIALTMTPSMWGHGIVVPAVVLAFVLHGHERLAGIVPILVVWAVMTPVLVIRASKQQLKVANR